MASHFALRRMGQQRDQVARVVASVVEAMEPRRLLSGALDPTFSLDGKLTIPFNASSNTASAVLVQPDGKTLVIGTNGSIGFRDFAIARLNVDGSFDGTFGQGGGGGTGRILRGLNGDDVATAATLQPDGKIVIVGYTSGGATSVNDFAVMRLNADGSFDNTFSTDGRTTIDFSFDDRASAVILQRDGKILIAGTQDGGSANFAVARLNTNGTLDTSFSFDGKREVTFGATDFATGIGIDSLNRIVVGGYTNVNDPDGPANGAPNEYAVMRLLPDGSMDTGFAGTGRRTVNFSSFSERANALVVDAQDRIVMVGQAFEGSADDFGFVRLLPNSAVDTSFGSQGFTSVTFGGADIARSLAISPDGRITAAGRTNGVTLDFAVARLLDNGTPDNAFDTDGEKTIDFNNSVDEAFAMAVGADGKIVVAGSIDSGDDFAVARLLGTGALTINGTTNADTISFDGTSYTVNGVTTPVDTTYVKSVVINGLEGTDTIDVNKVESSARVTVNGGTGNDTIGVGGGDVDSNIKEDVSVIGGFGDDDLFVYRDATDNDPGNTYDFNLFYIGRTNTTQLISYTNVARVQVNLPGGNETVNLMSTNSSSAVSIFGNGGNDTIVAGGGDFDSNFFGDVTVNGGAGIDRLIFNDVNDTGDDDYFIGANSFNKSTAILSFAYATMEAIELNTGATNDNISAIGATLPITFNTGAGHDTAFGGSGNDSFVGGVGDDSFIGNDGNDTMRGGAGNDFLYADAGDDQLFGDAGNDTLFGVDGNDSLVGGAGNDQLFDEAGNDTMVGGGGNDLYEFLAAGAVLNNDVISEAGGQGLDTLDFSSIASAIVIQLNTATVATHTNRTVTSLPGQFANFENATGGNGADRIVGNALGNTLKGNGGPDTLIGNGGADSLIGDAGNDRLEGNAGNDTLVGGANSDMLLGGDNADTFFAADGAIDTLDGGSGVDVLGSSDGVDVLNSVP